MIGLFLTLVIAGITAGRRAGDLQGALLAIGISTWIGLQAMFNIGVAVGALPNKGITLPFVSYGGTSLVVTMFAAGILLNIARRPHGLAGPSHAGREHRSGPSSSPAVARVDTSSQASPSRGRWSPGASRAPRSASWVRPAGSRRSWCPPPASRCCCCRAGGSNVASRGTTWPPYGG